MDKYTNFRYTPTDVLLTHKDDWRDGNIAFTEKCRRLISSRRRVIKTHKESLSEGLCVHSWKPKGRKEKVERVCRETCWMWFTGIISACVNMFDMKTDIRRYASKLKHSSVLVPSLNTLTWDGADVPFSFHFTWRIGWFLVSLQGALS